MTDEDDKPKAKLYTLQTTAPYKLAYEVAVTIATRFGHMAFLSETPEGAEVVVPRRVWTPGRWWLVFITLSGSPFFFHWVWPGATNLQGFGLGWITAATIILAGRTHD